VVRLGHAIRGKYSNINCRLQGNRNRDEFFLGPRSARVGSSRGDSHFWVIQRHKLSGVVFFLI
jgi:hypothetical protein